MFLDCKTLAAHGPVALVQRLTVFWSVSVASPRTLLPACFKMLASRRWQSSTKTRGFIFSSASLSAAAALATFRADGPLPTLQRRKLSQAFFKASRAFGQRRVTQRVRRVLVVRSFRPWNRFIVWCENRCLGIRCCLFECIALTARIS